MLVTSGIVALVVAILAGAWRNYCSFWAHKFVVNCPPAWNTDLGRFASLLIVALASIWASKLAADRLFSGPFVWWVAFSVFLIVRWVISKLIGEFRAGREYTALKARLLDKEQAEQ